jgi:hypothetical protein
MIGLKVRTNQEAFDEVVRHLSTLKGQAIAAGEVFECVYLTEDGRRCAVGALLAVDDDTAAQLSGDVWSLVEQVDVGDVDAYLLSGLQVAHDHRTHWHGDQFRGYDYLREIAGCYKLDTSVLDEVSA